MTDKSVVRQHNYLTEAKYTMSEAEKNIFILVITQLKKGDAPGHKYYVSMQDLKDVGVTMNSKRFSKAALELAKKNLTIRELDNPTNWETYSLFDKATYRNGTIEFVLGYSIRDYLFRVKVMFTRIRIKEILSISGRTAKRFYELACRWENLHEEGKGTLEVSVDDLNDMLGTAYEYKALKRSVIDPAIKEINSDKTTLTLTFDPKNRRHLIKQGRKVVGIRVGIVRNVPDAIQEAEVVVPDIATEAEPKPAAAPPAPQLSPVAPGGERSIAEKRKVLVDRLVGLGLDQPQAITVMKTVGVSKKSGIWVLLNEVKQGIKDGKVVSPKGFLVKKLNDKYGLGLK